MKWIKYQILVDENTLAQKQMQWNEINEQTAKGEAYNGEYVIEDDGIPMPEEEPTPEELLNAMLGVEE